MRLEDLREAESLLTNAEDSWKAGRKEEEVDITARKGDQLRGEG